MRVDVNSPVALALRSLQKLDQVEPIGRRELLLEAQTLLGEELGLVCTGEAEGGGFYDHSGDTCEIHEWLVPEDADGLERP